MKLLNDFGKTLMDGNFWLHAGAVLVGFKASDMINAATAGIKQIPEPVKPFVGPVVVVLTSPLLGSKFGPYVALGAALNVADSLLGMVGFPQGQIRQG
jgi:hypothetical protein